MLISSATAGRPDSNADALQAMHDAALAGMLGSAEVPYPSRPNIFKSPVELRQYLDALNAYYAIAGRPRFGKRGDAPSYHRASPPSSSSSSSHMMDLYDY
ncbi:hypothetical protein SK128_003332 [Halocaridina rubra]|uniref:Neuropeptide F n=1 Tax=Halocaridina rubra TaxID=373956 RepID=A0AAN8XRG5_HALRR